MTVLVISGSVIGSFGSKETERIWHEQYVKRVDRTVQRAGMRKLELIHAATDLDDLRILPGNRLQRLVGDLRYAQCEDFQHTGVKLVDPWNVDA